MADKTTIPLSITRCPNCGAALVVVGQEAACGVGCGRWWESYHEWRNKQARANALTWVRRQKETATND